jgi:hypothetical protein
VSARTHTPFELIVKSNVTASVTGDDLQRRRQIRALRKLVQRAAELETAGGNHDDAR